ncbi:hypothetical protein QCA50_009954 [Cerrena zonata]|uniref:Uncharacterized protein n=1 Tax=Cerrena zonata TaxID=2478898 RepID=A0AAW0G0L9_9APHY
MTAVASKDGPLALFRGVNAQFIHQTLSHTIEAWITGFISPFLGSPDSISSPESLDSPNLLTQDLANTTNIDQPSPSSNKINTRSIRDSIRNYPIQLLLRPPPTIALLTILHQFSTIENLLRKEQINFLLRPKSLEEDEKRVVTIDNPDEDLIVEYNSWNLHETLYEDNLDDNDDINDAEKKSISLIKAGGITGFLEKVKRLNLFNGWRVAQLQEKKSFEIKLNHLNIVSAFNCDN